MRDIRVSTAKLTEIAGQIRTINERLYADLNEIEARLAITSALWESEAGDEIRLAMLKVKNNFFDSYKAVILSYATFLEESATQYEITEKAIQTNATNFE